MLNNFCFHVYAKKSHSHSLTRSLFHSLTLDMLNTMMDAIQDHATGLVNKGSGHSTISSISDSSLQYSQVFPTLPTHHHKFLTSSSSFTLYPSTPEIPSIVINWYWYWQFRLFSPLSNLNTEPIKFQDSGYQWPELGRIGGETVTFCHNESDGTTFFYWVGSDRLG